MYRRDAQASGGDERDLLCICSGRRRALERRAPLAETDYPPIRLQDQACHEKDPDLRSLQRQYRGGYGDDREIRLAALPVVDSIGRLVGRITIDDVMDEVRESNTSVITSWHPVSRKTWKPRIMYSLQTAARLPWLLIGMIEDWETRYPRWFREQFRH